MVIPAFACWKDLALGFGYIVSYMKLVGSCEHCGMRRSMYHSSLKFDDVPYANSSHTNLSTNPASFI